MTGGDAPSSLCCLFRLWSELHALPASCLLSCSVRHNWTTDTGLHCVPQQSRCTHLQWIECKSAVLSYTAAEHHLPGRQSSHRHRYIQFSRRRFQTSKLHLVFHSSSHKLKLKRRSNCPRQLAEAKTATRRQCWIG